MPDLQKKTALDDDASIYRTDRSRTEKQKWEEMDKKQRRQYFADYYLGKMLGMAAGIFALFFLSWHFLKPADETVLYVAVVDESLDKEKLEEMTEDLCERFGADGKHKKVLIDDTFFMKDDALTRMEVYLHSRQLDAVIADETVWRELAGYGFFQQLDEMPDEFFEESGDTYEFLETEGYLDSEDISFEDHEVGMGMKAPYGVSLAGSRRFKEMKAYMEHPVFAVTRGTENEERAELFLEYLME